MGLLEQSDRARRVTEQELSDTNEQLSELTCANQALAGGKRKLESEMETLHGDLDGMVSEAQLSDDKCKKAMVDAARLAEELRAEQELALNFERDRKLLECQVKDMGARLDEAETNALKGGKKAMLKMETRIKSYKKQIEEAEEIAALNLAKYRNAHAQLADAEERADLNEQALAKSRAKGRGSVPL